MKKSIFFYKELTPAEVGNTGTHEIYVRLPNNFDYESFFNDSAVENGSVLEVNFSAQDTTDGENTIVPLRFVYFHNSNGEKRIPSLGTLFQQHNVQEGDIVCLESRIAGANTTYFIHFYKKGEIQVNPNSIYFSCIKEDNDRRILKSTIDQPLQQIYYGAPGTGKSDTIYETTKDLSEVNVFRTTFHPDSDYSTFVGAYKPTMKSSEKIYTPEELTVKLKEIKSSGTPYPCHKFSTKYWKSLKDLSAESIKKILAACGFTEAYSVEVSKCIAIGQEYMDKPEDGRITYTFCPQAFTNAYVRAWQTKEPVFLIIEEINRGNCAQIFGDLFQLLDRDEDGYSKYEIVADNDLANHIKEKLENADDRENLTTSIKEGRELKLPNNLYIWATMNTSDQSLFPIDSAFKRRWDWKYIKIKKGVDKQTKEPLNWQIKVGEEIYDWWEFLKKINFRIAQMTSSADKQLGYFFCLADNNEISADTFVNKVAFYLWNDVFKDYAEDGSPLLKYKKKEDDKEESDLTFPDFFDEQGKIDENVVKQFIDHVIKDEKTENKAE